MKGSNTMEIIFAVAVFVVAMIKAFFILSSIKAEDHNSTYETAFCRDVRAELGMFAYPSDVEKKRQKLNNKKSKF